MLDAGETTIAASAMTDGSGAYTLTLNPGTYVVCEVLQAPWTQSRPTNTKCVAGSGLGPGGYALTVTSGSSETGNDFGNFQQGTKSGVKFNDLNGNGARDAGEPGLLGWTIEAFADGNGDGTLSATEAAAAPAAVAITDASGAYTLTLNPGTYVVCEVLQPTWTQSKPANTKCAAGSPTLGPGGYALTVTLGSSDTGNDFGNFQKGSKSGVKYNDLNGNGAKDVGEPGLPGWTINAYVDANGNGMLDAGETTVATSAVTDGVGAYSLSLNPGKYIICEVQQAPWTQSEPANTKCGASSGGYAVTVTSGSTESGNNFGNFQKGTKSGVKFNDLNGNGVKDMGEPGLSGWEIRAYKDLDGDGTLSVAEAAVGPASSMTTNGSGAYSFSLNPGKYVICEVLQSGWVESRPANVKCAGGSGFRPGAGGHPRTGSSASSGASK